MANYPQLDDQVGVWKLKDVNSAVMGGYWRNGGSRAVFGGGDNDGAKNVIDFITITSTGNANIRTYATYSVFGRGSDFSFTLITSENGAVGGVAFALSRNSTTGAIRLSNASNLTCQSTMVFY